MGNWPSPGGKHVKWLEDPTVLVMFPIDQTISLIPKRCLSPEQMEAIRQAVTGEKIPLRKIIRTGTIIWFSVGLLVFMPIACRLVAWSLYSVFKSFVGI
jgi:hypothetical protein